MSGLGETTCRGAPVETVRSGSRTLAGCKREDHGLGRAPNADHRAGRLGGAALCRGRRLLWRHREQPPALPARSRGYGGDTVDPRSWGRGVGGFGDGGAKQLGVVRVNNGRAHVPSTPEVARRAPQSFGLAVFAHLFGGHPRPTPTRTVWLPFGASARACSGRAQTVDGPSGPDVVFVSVGRVLVARPGVGVAHGAEVATGMLGPNAPRRLGLRVHR
jgi:hypothetical protein